MVRKQSGRIAVNPSQEFLYAKRKKIASIINTTSHLQEGCSKRIKQLQRKGDELAIKSGELYRDARAVKGKNRELSEKLYAEWSATQKHRVGIVDKINHLRHQEYQMGVHIAEHRAAIKELDRRIAMNEKVFVADIF